MVSRWGNVTGAFADTGVLFPLLAMLVATGAVAPGPALATTGLAYIVSGWIFRVPMSVQPFKALAAGAVAAGASLAELRVAGALIGVVLLLVLVLRLDRQLDRIPPHIVHSVQLALGLLLALQGLDVARRQDATALGSAAPLAVIAVVLLAGAIVIGTEKWRLPLLGVLAMGMVAWSLAAPATSTVATASAAFRLQVVLGLVVAQLPLTLTNSVVSTVNVADRAFGERASRVTIRSLLHAIGWGNLAVAAVGGLPYCHGAGGLTAHVRGGSTHWVSNVVIGGFVLVLAGVEFLGGVGVLSPPPWVLAVLLLSVGGFHVLLARPTWAIPQHRLQLVAAAIVAVVTRDLLLALAAATIVWAVESRWRGLENTGKPRP